MQLIKKPLIYDLLDVKNDLIEYEDDNKVKKKAVLTDNDDLF
jgi:hypothetical protein